MGTKASEDTKEELNKIQAKLSKMRGKISHATNYSGEVYQNLDRLSKEQLIKIIYDYHIAINRIGEICVSESKSEIGPEAAVNKVRETLNRYDKYRLYNKNLDLFIDVQLGKISAREYMNGRRERQGVKKEDKNGDRNRSNEGAH